MNTLTRRVVAEAIGTGLLVTARIVARAIGRTLTDTFAGIARLWAWLHHRPAHRHRHRPCPGEAAVPTTHSGVPDVARTLKQRPTT